jgi:hypothetical protein
MPNEDLSIEVEVQCPARGRITKAAGTIPITFGRSLMCGRAFCAFMPSEFFAVVEGMV